MDEKGVSDIIATVLLISFTVAVAGLVFTWGPNFVEDLLGTTSREADREIYCTYGGMAVDGLKYCNGRLAGSVRNSGSVTLGNITIQVLYMNETPSDTIHLLPNGSTNYDGFSNLTLRPGNIKSFNVSIAGPNYEIIRIISNCTNVAFSSAYTGVTAC